MILVRDADVPTEKFAVADRKDRPLHWSFATPLARQTPIRCDSSYSFLMGGRSVVDFGAARSTRGYEGGNMNCMASLFAAGTDEESLPKMELHAPMVQQVRDRQAATSYLQAATMTDNAVKRTFLRRRAAELILPRLGHRGQRLAC